MNAILRRSSVKRLLVWAAALPLAAPVHGQEVPDLRSPTVPNPLDGQLEQLDRAVLGGKWWLRLRYRVENVDQDGFTREAWASTLRTILGYESEPWHEASVVLEFENVSVLGNEQYDSTVNGKTGTPVVADPDSSEVNQAYLKLAPLGRATLALGRQVVTLDNHRFVGDVGWRQNQQTFDAATLRWKPTEHMDLFYGFIDNVNRVFGEDSPQGDHRMASHLLNAGYDLADLGRLTGYAYLLDYDSVDSLSSNTLGLRFAGSHALRKGELLYTAEYAAQTDAADNPNEVDQDYLLLELGAKACDFTLQASREVLGGSGDAGDAFQTPLATLHGFNGWADKFLTTPDSGLQDFAITLGKKIAAFDVKLVWHDFQADSGGLDYGTELDASFTWKVAEKVVVGLKLADYRADDFATDTTKAWLWLAYAP